MADKITCDTCFAKFPNYQELAFHIQTSAGHDRSRKWALMFMTKANLLNRKQDFSGRMPLTEEDKANKEDCQRPISGEFQQIQTVCPHCQHLTRQILPVEFIHDPFTWHINNHMAVTCPTCRK